MARTSRRFQKRDNKILEHKSGDEPPSHMGSSTWAYFDQMLFLKNVVGRRKFQGNISPKDVAGSNVSTPESTQHCDESSAPSPPTSNSKRRSSQQSSDHSQQFLESGNMEPTPTTNNRKTSLDKNSTNDQFLQIEKEKLKLFTDSTALEDSEYQFLLSLLPFLHKVPNHRKLVVGNKLQQVLIDEDERGFRISQFSSECTPVPSPVIF